MNRRRATKLLGGSLLTAVLDPSDLISQQRRRPARVLPPAAPKGPFVLSADDDGFLDDMSRRAVAYFVEQSGPLTGQVLDRAINRTSTGELDPRRTASIAATGFGLSALCIADMRGYLPGGRIRQQVVKTLQYHLERLPHEHGFFYHFNDANSGRPLSFSEVSSIDTAIMICGVLTCRAYFSDDTRITDLASRLYNRVEWPWMLNGGSTFSMGWHPDSGFIATRWDHYCELMMLYLLAIGSPTYPIAPTYWGNFARPRIRYGPYTYVSARDPLFVHQYSHAWFDFRRKRDSFTNYFENSVTATRAHQAFLMSLNRGYTDDFWGVSASDWQHGYTAWGGPPLMGPVDGTVVPCATAGSLPFLPEECLRVQRSLLERHGRDAWGRYGFCDAFHPSQLWYDPDVLGIDLGISVLMAENLRSGFIWDTFMRNPEMPYAMKLCGFHDTGEPPPPTATPAAGTGAETQGAI